jgi:hypothetical protein
MSRPAIMAVMVLSEPIHYFRIACDLLNHGEGLPCG